MSQASAGTVPGVPAWPRRKGLKAELDGLRERMRGLGLGHDEIAAEISRQYMARPREAYRLAWGWTLDQAAGRFNEHAAREGADPQARASMTGPHLCEYEKWPRSTRRPSVYVLCVLAAIYQADALSLLDLADHEGLPQQDRLVLSGGPRAGTGATVIPGTGPEPAGTGHGQAGIMRLGPGEGMSLMLPYVPGRLLIELSGPAGLAEAGSGAPGAAGRLVLVRDGFSWADGSDAV
jgi:hypothetical protein